MIKTPENLTSFTFEQRLLGRAMREDGFHHLNDRAVTVGMFDSAIHRDIYFALEGMAKDQIGIDPFTMQEWLDSHGLTNDGLNLSYLLELYQIPGADYDAEIVRKKWEQRMAWLTLANAIEGAARGDLDVSSLIAKLVSMERPAGSNEHDSQQIAKAAVDEVERIVMGVVTGVKYGITALDDVTGGAHNTDLVVIAARAAMGKTAFLVNVMTNAVLAGTSVGFISSEMPAGQIGIRIGALVGQMNASEARRKGWSDSDFGKFNDGLSRTLMGNDLLIVNDSAHITIGEVERCARRWKRQRGIKALYLDYIQRIRGSDQKQPRHEQVTEVVQRLKTLARDLEIPVIALAQMNRDNDKLADKRPQLGGIANSSEIEKEADQIMTLYRDEVYNPETTDRGVAEIDFKKNRHGGNGVIRLAWTGAMMRFADFGKNEADYETTC